MKTSIGKDIEIAAQLLSNGQTVAIPTETVYGLAANALNEDAVLKIFEAKQRPFFDPLIVHIAEPAHIYRYAKMPQGLSTQIQKLIDVLWPGPLTLVLPKADIIPDVVTSGLPTVGLRMPAHPMMLQLLKMLDFPLAAPSANPFGYISPTSAQHVFNQLQNKIPYILDGGNCSVGLESTIAGEENGQIIIYRLGGTPLEKIENIVGKVKLRLHKGSNIAAPGQLDSHYAPRKAFFVGDIYAFLRQHPGKKTGVISFNSEVKNSNVVANWVLSPEGDLHEAAKKLFYIMREADESEAEILIAEFAPENGLGLAINDRLRRAAFNM